MVYCNYVDLMRSTITLLIGLSIIMLFVNIHGISYVKAQSALNNVSSSDTKSIDANSAVASEKLDPFILRGSSNDASTANNDHTTDSGSESSTSSSNDNEVSASDSGSSTSSSKDDNKDSSTSSSKDDNKDSSTSSSHDNRDDSDHGSDDDKSSKGDKNNSKNDKKFELPFP